MKIFEVVQYTSQFSALTAIKAILGDRAVYDDGTDKPELFKPGMILVTKDWVNRGDDAGIFTKFGEPGTETAGGLIGLRDPFSRSPIDVATGAHEAFHALLWIKGKNSQNEHLVNKLTTNWLKQNVRGEFLRLALERITQSKESYKGKKYSASRKFASEYAQSLKDAENKQ